MNPTPHAMKMVGLVLRPEAEQQAAMVRSVAALRDAMTPAGLDTSRLVPPPSRMMPVVEDAAGNRFVLDGAISGVPTPVPVATRFPGGLPADFVPMDPAAAEPAAVAGVPPVDPAAGTVSSPSVPASAPAAVDVPAECIGAAADGVADRGAAGDIGPALLAMGAAQNPAQTQALMQRFLAERMAGLVPGGGMYKSIQEALAAM